MLKLALTFKWLGALLLCLVLAGTFAALAQWQVTRSVIPNSDSSNWDVIQAKPLEEITSVGEPYQFIEISKQGKDKVLTEVQTSVSFDPSAAVLVANRIQLDGREGYWLVVPGTTVSGKVFAAVGFAKDEVTAQQVLADAKASVLLQALMPIQARYIPSEAPEQGLGKDIFSSLSISQLINLSDVDTNKESDVYTGALVLTELKQFSSIPNLEPITIGLARSDAQLNWLSAFYAIEWTVFAGFALFIWWRLLSDAYLKQQGKIGE